MNEDPTVLLSGLGQEVLAQVAAQAPDAVPDLAVATRLRRDYPAALVAAAMAQHELRLLARAKFSRARQMLFTREGYEQASGELVGTYRSARLKHARTVVDLCCGIGGDLVALGSISPERHILAVDRNATHARLAVHNASVYGAAARAVVADVRDLRLAGVDAVFIDPARREDGRRFRTGVSEPPLEWCLRLVSGGVVSVCVKAAPGLDTAVVPAGWELEFIAVGRDLKEAVLWSPALASTSRRATVLPGPHALLAVPGPPVRVAAPGPVLLDPSPAVTRAGLVEDLARQVGAWKIDPQIAFLSLDEPVATPFARTLTVIESAPWNEKRFAARLRELGVGAADLRRRGLAGDVDQIRRRLKLQGPRHATVVLTRVNDKPWGLICQLAAQQDAAHELGLPHVAGVVVEHADQAHAEGDRRVPVLVDDPLQVRVADRRQQGDRLRVHRLVVLGQQRTG